MGMAWKKINNNEIIEGNDFYVSYNPFTYGLETVSFFMSDDSRPETALVVTRNNTKRFLILNGDFRKEYEAAYPKGLGACLKVYISHLNLKSTWSEDVDMQEWLTKRKEKMQ